MATVAVVGATGRQGSATARHLLAAGWDVRALTRKPTGSAARALVSLGAEPRKVELEDVASLRSAFDGAIGVFNVQNPMTSSIEAEIRQGRNVAEAAAGVGVAHVVYGAAGVGDVETGVPSWDSKVVVARAFRERGLALTVLRPMAFMELMTDKGFYPSLAVWSVMPRLAGASRPIGWLSLDDLGAIAAHVFTAPDQWADADLALVADVRSIDECRSLWYDEFGHRPRRTPIPAWLFERFVGPDLPTMWRWLHDHDFDMSVDPTRSILPGALTVREWLASGDR
ncbi:NAD-dependent epimerase/dehydratase family protein [Nocardioides immobilis]|uniref:NAD-dependent epimerase/dehydratase family protein n=1 Tax=Nocardioides immobilis TaxID=2049295 RepID=A0A417XWC1_9ACTN|nr:NmrA family NAD(P)-binding protein [Nocardioides immobilis]RHW24673.1 NAD-dependent epimerase/dehydratase family protein [Nocardioides immobilis]